MHVSLCLRPLRQEVLFYNTLAQLYTSQMSEMSADQGAISRDIPIVIKPHTVDVLTSLYDRSFHIRNAFMSVAWWGKE